MIGYEDEILQLKEIFLKEILLHVFMFEELKLRWTLEITEEIHNRNNVRKSETEFKLRFCVNTDVNSNSPLYKKREITIYKHDMEDWNTNPLRILQDCIFNWDYTKINEYFNDKK